MLLVPADRPTQSLLDGQFELQVIDHLLLLRLERLFVHCRVEICAWRYDSRWCQMELNLAFVIFWEWRLANRLPPLCDHGRLNCLAKQWAQKFVGRRARLCELQVLCFLCKWEALGASIESVIHQICLLWMAHLILSHAICFDSVAELLSLIH